MITCSLQSQLLQRVRIKRSNLTGSISLGSLKSKYERHSLITSLLETWRHIV